MANYNYDPYSGQNRTGGAGANGRRGSSTAASVQNANVQQPSGSDPMASLSALGSAWAAQIKPPAGNAQNQALNSYMQPPAQSRMRPSGSGPRGGNAKPAGPVQRPNGGATGGGMVSGQNGLPQGPAQTPGTSGQTVGGMLGGGFTGGEGQQIPMGNDGVTRFNPPGDGSAYDWTGGRPPGVPMSYVPRNGQWVDPRTGVPWMGATPAGGSIRFNPNTPKDGGDQGQQSGLVKAEQRWRMNPNTPSTSGPVRDDLPPITEPYVPNGPSDTPTGPTGTRPPMPETPTTDLRVRRPMPIEGGQTNDLRVRRPMDPIEPVLAAGAQTLDPNLLMMMREPRDPGDGPRSGSRPPLKPSTQPPPNTGGTQGAQNPYATSANNRPIITYAPGYKPTPEEHAENERKFGRGPAPGTTTPFYGQRPDGGRYENPQGGNARPSGPVQTPSGGQDGGMVNGFTPDGSSGTIGGMIGAMPRTDGPTGNERQDGAQYTPDGRLLGQNGIGRRYAPNRPAGGGSPSGDGGALPPPPNTTPYPGTPGTATPPAGTPGPASALDLDPTPNLDYLDPVYQDALNQVQRKALHMGSLTGNINSGGFVPGVTEQMGQLSNQFAAQKGGMMFQAQQAQADRILDKYKFDNTQQLQRWITENENELKKYGIDANVLLGRYQADRGVDSAMANASGMASAAQAAADASRYNADLDYRLGGQRLGYDYWNQSENRRYDDMFNQRNYDLGIYGINSNIYGMDQAQQRYLMELMYKMSPGGMMGGQPPFPLPGQFPYGGR